MMLVPATLILHSRTRTGGTPEAHEAVHVTAHGAPLDVVAPLARFVDWCQTNGTLPTGDAYDTYTAQRHSESFAGVDQPASRDRESLFVYTLEVQQTPGGGWTGSLAVDTKSLTRRSPAMVRLLHLTFDSDNIGALHNYAVECLTRGIDNLRDQGRPSQTAAQEQKLQQQVWWHSNRRSDAARSEARA